MIFSDACCQENLGRMILYEIDARLLSVRHRMRSLQLVCGGAFRAEAGRFELLPSPLGWWCVRLLRSLPGRLVAPSGALCFPSPLGTVAQSPALAAPSRQVGRPLGFPAGSRFFGGSWRAPGSGGSFPTSRLRPWCVSVSVSGLLCCHAPYLQPLFWNYVGAVDPA